MNNYKISVNQLADFSNATEATKRRIIKEQIKPNKVKVPRYQLSKAKIKKSLELGCDLAPITEGIRILEDRQPATDWQVNDKKVSMEALKRFLNLRFPKILKRIKYSTVKPVDKVLEVGEVHIIVAPEIVIRGQFMGVTVIGGIKIHLSKTKPFDLAKAQCVSSIICKYLKDVVAKDNETVLPELCFCLEVFDERMVPAPEKYEQILSTVKETCEEVKLVWKHNNV